MNLSYKILSVFGIDIELHLFFVLFILAFLIINPLFSLLLILVFFYVTLHELCHSIVAIRHKIKVKKIILLPIGGMAMIETTKIKPMTEIKMALAGPLFNFIIVYVCLIIANIFRLPIGEWFNLFLKGGLELTIPQLILFYSLYANLILGLFNFILPAMPLDGGRIFRAVLALKMDYVKATRIARTVSLTIVGLLFIIGLFYGDLWIMIIAFFIGFGAIAEFEATIFHQRLSKLKTKDIISKDFIIVKPKDSVKKIVVEMISRKALHALVRDKKIKVLELTLIARIPRTKWDEVKAESLAKDVGFVSPRTPIELVLKKMMEKEVNMLPVLERGKLVGVIYRLDIEKMVRITELLGK